MGGWYQLGFMELIQVLDLSIFPPIFRCALLLLFI